ncbi:uncharacterized protein DNG_09671 [Cephalotrichum gorgonifer]|uniref:Uncharacterized protein n=1 Tax=Cephalotrichum gorgonifer TaxID=2041049 RepID=A0AAE8T0D2_9PEZI|nr:uncharacterized protein DNG_09671 [Cephalotrichum gorgonifer]
MADSAGFIPGITAAWKRVVEIFDTPRDLAAEMKAIESHIVAKNEGCLMVGFFSPHPNNARVDATTYWGGCCKAHPLSPVDDYLKGFVKSEHASFDLYKRKQYTKNKPSKYDLPDEESVFFHAETFPQYENENVGTVTVEGFGIECWGYEGMSSKLRYQNVSVLNRMLPSVPATKLLRRVEELRRGGECFGRNPEKEEADLEEFFGKPGASYTRQNSHMSRMDLQVNDLVRSLNRDDIFANFLDGSSICTKWLGGKEQGGIGLLNMLWQMIIAKQLSMCLTIYNQTATDFTQRTLSSLIVQDLWFQNVEIKLTNMKIGPASLGAPATDEEAVKAARFEEDGDAAVRDGEYEKAADLYTAAVNIDPRKMGYRCKRAATLLTLKRWEDAEEDAYICTQVDPEDADGWSQLGMARLGVGLSKRAREAFQRSIAVSGDAATAAMRKDLKDAEEKIAADMRAIEMEPDSRKKLELEKAYRDQDWDLGTKTIEIHSLAHKRQVEGLILFAERMRWPYLNEMRNFAKTAYSNFQAGKELQPQLYDWMYGLTLPGMWMSFKIMSALILCTPSIADRCSVAPTFDCGLVTPHGSYWRARTVLGRVLGCLPGVISLCGWVGPCPAVDFDSTQPQEGEDAAPRHIRIEAQVVAPRKNVPNKEQRFVEDFRPNEATQRRDNEDIPTYLADMGDHNRWFTPKPPAHEPSTVTLKRIQLKALRPDGDIITGHISLPVNEAVINKQDHHVHLVFALESNEATVTYTLHTNPLFVTLPACREGPHEVHMREETIFRSDRVRTVDQLKGYTPKDDDGGVMIINATGTGAEVLARAWCSERGKHAVVRRQGGPCYTCAVRAASGIGLGVGVVIWVS